MNDERPDELELAAWYALNPPAGVTPNHVQQAQALLERVTMETNDGGLELCLSRLITTSVAMRPELVFWCLQVLFSVRHRLSLAQVRALCRSAHATEAAPGFVKNKVAQLVAELVAERYPRSWPNAIAELLQILDQEGMLRFLRALHEQILAREAQRNTEAARVKDAMRTDGAALLLLDWWLHQLRVSLIPDSDTADTSPSETTSLPATTGLETSSAAWPNTETVVVILQLIAEYAYWMDLSAIVERFQEPLFRLASIPIQRSSSASIVSAAVSTIQQVLLRKVPTPTEKMQLWETLRLLELTAQAIGSGSVSLAAWASLMSTMLLQLSELHETEEASVRSWALSSLRTILEHLFNGEGQGRLLLHVQILPTLSTLVRTLPNAEWDSLFSRLLSAILQQLMSRQDGENDDALNGVEVDGPSSAVLDTGVWRSSTFSGGHQTEWNNDIPAASDESFPETIKLLGQLVKRMPTLVLETMQQLPSRRLRAQLLLELTNYVPTSAQDMLWKSARRILSEPFMDCLYFDAVTRFGTALLPTTPVLYAYILPMLVSALESDSLKLRAHAASSSVRLVQALRGALAQDAATTMTPLSRATMPGEDPEADVVASPPTTLPTAGSWPDSSIGEGGIASTQAMLIQSGRFRVEYLLHHFQGLVRLNAQDTDLNLVQMPLVECISLLISSEALSSDDRVQYLESCLAPMHAAGLFRNASGLRAVLHLSKGFTSAQCNQDARLTQSWLSCLEWILEATLSPTSGLDEFVRPLLHRFVELLPEPSISIRLADYIEVRLRHGAEAVVSERDLQALVLLANQLCARFQVTGLAAQQRLFMPMSQALLVWFPLLSVDSLEAPSETERNDIGDRLSSRAETAVLSEEARERCTLRNLFYMYLSHLMNHGLASLLTDAANQAIWPCLLQVIAAGAVGIHFQSIELAAGTWRPCERVAKLPELETTTLTRAALSVLGRLAGHWAGQRSAQQLDATLLQTLPGLFRCAPGAILRENLELQIILVARLPEATDIIQLILHEATSRGCTPAACVQYMRMLSQLAELRGKHDRRDSMMDGIDSKQTAALLPLLRQIIQALAGSSTTPH
jgi:hypothetical protein